MSRTRYTIAFDLHGMVPGPAASATIQTIYKSEGGILLCYGTSAITTLEAEAADTYAPGCIYILVSGTSSKAYVNQAAAGAVANFGLLHAGDAASAPTAALTNLSGAGIAPGTPDYAIQDLTNSSPYGFVTADEGETIISVVQNNKTRLAEVIAALQTVGIMGS